MSAIQKLRDVADEVARVKGRDYTQGSSDRLANFRESANHAGITPLAVWTVFIHKHHSAVMTHLKTEGRSESEPIFMRFVDLYNYVRLGWLIVSQDDRLFPPDDETAPCTDFVMIDSRRTKWHDEDEISVSLPSLASWLEEYRRQYFVIVGLIRRAPELAMTGGFSSRQLVLKLFSNLLELVEFGWLLVSRWQEKQKGAA